MTSNPFPLSNLSARLRGNAVFVIGAVLMSVVLAMIVLSFTIYRGNPLGLQGLPFLFPGEEQEHVLGTDMLGRDMLMLLLHGARVSVLIGLCAALLAVVLGVTVGVLAGYFGGALDWLLTRITELFQTLPQLLLALALVAVLTPSIWSVVLAIGLTSWTQIARVVRPEVARLRGADFVQAANLSGMSSAAVIWHEVLPNITSTIIALATILIANAILTESALSFLGLGDPNIVTWGAMIGSGRAVMRDAWWVAAFPGITTLVTVLAFTLLGNGLSNALNRRVS